MSKALITLHIPNEKHPVLRIVEYPDPGEPGFYRQATSLSHFRTRELNRAFPDKHRLIGSNVNWIQYAQMQKYASVDWLFGDEVSLTVLLECQMQGIAFEDIPVSNGVWQLYEDIGYDRKKPKFVTR